MYTLSHSSKLWCKLTSSLCLICWWNAFCNAHSTGLNASSSTVESVRSYKDISNCLNVTVFSSSFTKEIHTFGYSRNCSCSGCMASCSVHARTDQVSLIRFHWSCNWIYFLPPPALTICCRQPSLHCYRYSFLVNSYSTVSVSLSTELWCF